MGSTKARYLFLNGGCVPYDEAKVHVLAPAMKYGATVYEGIRGYFDERDSQIYLFRIQDHLRRLYQSMEMTWIKPPFDLAELERHTIETVKKNEFREDIHIRIMAFIQSDDGGMTSRDSTGIAIATLPMGRSSSKSETGLHCGISSWRRISDASTPPRIKCAGNYQNSRLAGIEAIEHGYDNVLILNENGKLSEGAGSNVFIIRKGIPMTPAVTNNILEGLTRDTLVRLFREKLGLGTEERDIDRTELYVADEAFYCGSAMEVVPIISVDKHPVGDGTVGPLTRAIKSHYLDVVRGRDGSHADWRTPVY